MSYNKKLDGYNWSGTNYLKDRGASRSLAYNIANYYRSNPSIPKNIREQIDVRVEVNPGTGDCYVRSNIGSLMPSITELEDRYRDRR